MKVEGSNDRKKQDKTKGEEKKVTARGLKKERKKKRISRRAE